MKIKLFFLFVILFSLKTSAQTLNPTISISAAGSANLFKGGYTFAYATSGTPWNGALLSFGGFSNQYDCQFSTDYAPGGGNHISYRTKNGDLAGGVGVWNPWYELATRGVNTFTGNQTVNGDLIASISSIEGGRISLLNPSKTAPDTSNKWVIYNMTGVYGNSLQFWNYLNNGGGGSRMTLTDAGNVGIGTPAPTNKLDVSGEIALGSSSVNANTTKLFLRNPAGKTWAISSGANNITESSFSVYNWTDSPSSPFFHINVAGNVGIGTANPTNALTIQKVSGGVGFSGTDGTGGVRVNWSSGYGVALDAWDSNTPRWGITRFSGNIPTVILEGKYNSKDAYFNSGGNVGIGSTNPDEKLTVKGKIHAEEIKVDLAVPADYVFEKYYTGKSKLKSDYTIPTLAEIENFTKKNLHLPNVPSAKDIQKNGLSLGEMSNVLLQKIEELTLYAIEQNNKVMMQQKELERLKTENENYKSLAERLSAIEKKLKK